VVTVIGVSGFGEVGEVDGCVVTGVVFSGAVVLVWQDDGGKNAVRRANSINPRRATVLIIISNYPMNRIVQRKHRKCNNRRNKKGAGAVLAAHPRQ
jgi:hypothetical protein